MLARSPTLPRHQRRYYLTTSRGKKRIKMRKGFSPSLYFSHLSLARSLLTKRFNAADKQFYTHAQCCFVKVKSGVMVRKC